MDTFCSLMKQLHAMFPHMRIAQIISNATSGADIYYLTDAEIVQALKNYVALMSK